MEQLYERLVELLGKPRPASSELLTRLIMDLGEKPIAHCTDDKVWFYDFNDNGFKLYFYTEDGSFRMLTLCIGTAQVRAGDVRPYRGNLPFGISREDSREIVENKFPGGTMAVKDYRSDTDLRPIVVTFHFHGPDFNAPGVGEERLTMVTVEYLE